MTRAGTRLKHLFTLALLASLGCLLAAQPQPRATDEDTPSKSDPAQEDLKIPEPSFKPGATVSVAVLLKSPADWHLNYMLPVTLSFPKDYLKDAPFSALHESFSFTLKDYQDTYTALIPIKVGPKIQDGVYDVPLHLDCSICNKSAGACTFASEDFSFKLTVVSSSDKGAKDQALAKGSLNVTHLISVPE